MVGSFHRAAEAGLPQPAGPGTGVEGGNWLHLGAAGTSKSHAQDAGAFAHDVRGP